MGLTNLRQRDGSGEDDAAPRRARSAQRDNLIDSTRIDPAVWLVAATGALIASVGVLSGDALWLVPLGEQVVHGHLPRSITFAAAQTGGWHDVPAAAEVIFWAAYHGLGGERGLLALQVLACAIGFAALARGLRAEASGSATLLVSALVLAGALPTVVVIGTTLFSLALFPLLATLLEAQTRAPSRRIWLAVPLIALWGNLHGEVIAGWALLACYLVFERGRRDPLRSAGVLGAASIAVCLNPALWHTPSYYAGVFDNALAQQGSGLWAPLGTSTADLELVAIAAVLALLALRRPLCVHLWEAVALAGIAVGTVHVARTGVWFLFLVAYPAARALRSVTGQPRRRLVDATLLVGLLSLCLVVRGPSASGFQQLIVRAARSGQPVLAIPLTEQRVVLAGGRIWVGNPIDAFRPADQLTYLDWILGKPGGSAALAHVGYVLTAMNTRPSLLETAGHRAVLIARSDGEGLYRVRNS